MRCPIIILALETFLQCHTHISFTVNRTRDLELATTNFIKSTVYP